jgi:hypothetical protein
VGRTVRPEQEWWEGVYALWKAQGVERGFDINDIYFSGFCSQGDGASWTGQVDVMQYVAYHWKDIPLRVEIMQALEEEMTQTRLDVKSRGQYCHDKTMHMEEVQKEDDEGGDGVRCPGSAFHGAQPANLWEALGYNDPELPEFNAEILEAAQAYAREIYEALKEEYEHLTSDEYIAENCEANDYRFDEDGYLI